VSPRLVVYIFIAPLRLSLRVQFTALPRLNMSKQSNPSPLAVLRSDPPQVPASTPAPKIAAAAPGAAPAPITASPPPASTASQTVGADTPVAAPAPVADSPPPASTSSPAVEADTPVAASAPVAASPPPADGASPNVAAVAPVAAPAPVEASPPPADGASPEVPPAAGRFAYDWDDLDGDRYTTKPVVDSYTGKIKYKKVMRHSDDRGTGDLLKRNDVNTFLRDAGCTVLHPFTHRRDRSTYRKTCYYHQHLIDSLPSIRITKESQDVVLTWARSELECKYVAIMQNWADHGDLRNRNDDLGYKDLPLLKLNGFFTSETCWWMTERASAALIAQDYLAKITDIDVPFDAFEAMALEYNELFNHFPTTDGYLSDTVPRPFPKMRSLASYYYSNQLSDPLGLEPESSRRSRLEFAHQHETYIFVLQAVWHNWTHGRRLFMIPQNVLQGMYNTKLNQVPKELLGLPIAPAMIMENLRQLNAGQPFDRCWANTISSDLPMFCSTYFWWLGRAHDMPKDVKIRDFRFNGNSTFRMPLFPKELQQGTKKPRIMTDEEKLAAMGKVSDQAAPRTLTYI